MGRRLTSRTIPGWAVLWLAAITGCTNNPYPDADADKKILYSSFAEAPRTLDPAVAYTTAAHVVTANVYDTLLEYHYLKRPYQLMPGLAEAVPVAQRQEDGRETYRFKIRDGILFQTDPCFSLSQQDRLTRQASASDFAFQLARIADPAVNSPIASNFAVIPGFAEFGKRLVERRKNDSGFAKLAVHDQYDKAGPIEGLRVVGPLQLEIVLKQPDPQILYWFAMPFTTPVPWEAIVYYDGKEGRERFADHPVGTGPYVLSHYEKQYRFVLERSKTWYGIKTDGAPGAVFPTDIDQSDIAAKYIDPAYGGRRMPFIDRIYFSRERESIPRFNKFLQGYYDNGGIIKESFDTVVQDDRLSPEMAAKGMRLDKSVEPSVFYIGFNMEDKTVGEPASERGRRLRQAMSLVIDTDEYLRLFLNGRGVPAQSPLPPGLFGYDPDYKNPFREVDLARARKLLQEAGFGNGIDPATGKALRLTFDTPDTSAQGRLRYEYLVSAWRRLGINVEIKATTYNQFQAKIRNGAYQIYTWGWIADYPDPENFLFLLECASARSKSGGPNSSNFCNAQYDQLFNRMKDLPNTEKRADLIRQLVAIVERERPWIELFHRENYSLSHAWLVNSKPIGLSLPVYKYLDVQPGLRAARRAEWNAPVRWPAYLLIAILVIAGAPAVRTFYRERQ